DALARLLAPVLVFTADEIWENLPQAGGGDEVLLSVHLATFPESTNVQDMELRTRWASLFRLSDIVLGKLEEARVGKLIGSSLEARVQISIGKKLYELFKQYGEQLRYIFIVSRVELTQSDEGDDFEHLSVNVSRAEGEKCERRWNYSVHVGESER